MIGRRKRIFLYCQPLLGTGHYVRMFEIACALARRHEVYFMDGGRPIPRARRRVPFVPWELPRIYRGPNGLAAVDAGLTSAEVMDRRRRLLGAAMDQLKPDVIVVEHFPFSKWELQEEIVATLEHARSVNPDIQVLCSLRDIANSSTQNPASAGEFLQMLHEYFHRVLVHADARLVRLEHTFPWAAQIAVPVHYTGYVSEKLGPPAAEHPAPHAPAGGGNVIVSGGGLRDFSWLAACIEAWRVLERGAGTGGRRLFVFAPLFSTQEEVGRLEQQTRDNRICVRSFSAKFLESMASADLSISRAGYNTCTNILETRVRAILAPNPTMIDQQLRARLWAERGWALTLEAHVTPDLLAEAVQSALAGPVPRRDVDLNGAQKTCALLDDPSADATITEELS